MRRHRKIARGLARGFAKLLLRSGGFGAGVALRLLANDSSPEAEGWRKYAEAILAWRRGDHFAALEHMRAAARTLPDDPQIAVSLALAFANIDEWDVAIDTGERALKFFAAASQEPQLWQMLAWGYLITGRYRLVIELMQRMQDAEVSLTVIELPLLLARAMVWQQEPPVAQLRTLIRRQRSQLPAYLRFVEHLARTGHDRVGLLMLAALPPPAVVQAMDVMAHRAAANGDVQLILWAANALEKLEITLELSRAIAALAATVGGDRESALRYAEEARHLGPDEPLVQEKLAVVYMAWGDRRRALDAATRAVMRGSGDAFCAGLVAAELANKDAYAEARRIFATQRSGDAIGAMVGHVVQARIFAQQGQFEDAKRVLERAVAESVDVPQWARRPGLSEFLTENIEALASFSLPDEVERLLAELKKWATEKCAGSPEVKE